MTDSNDSFSNPTSASVLAKLKRLVSGSPATHHGPAASAVLDYLHSPHSQHEKTPERAEKPISSGDPIREAAMNHVRRLRIRAA